MPHQKPPDDTPDYDLFGRSNPRAMPPHFFSGHRAIDYRSARKADVSRQNYSVAPRFWYVDVTYECRRCRKEFCFTATEQQAWFEEYAFFVDTRPVECEACRRELRRLKELRQEYDREIAEALASDDLPLKIRVCALLEELLAARKRPPSRFLENQAHLTAQIRRLQRD